MATPRRTGGREPDVLAGDTPAGRAAVRRAQGPDATTDADRDRAYRQGQAAAKRALDERGRGRRVAGPAQVHDDPELQGYYEQGHGETVRDARRAAVGQRARSAASSAPATSAKSVGENGAGFVLGLIAFALVRNYLQGGFSGVRQWLAAKFVNHVEATPPGSSAFGGAAGAAAGNALRPRKTQPTREGTGPQPLPGADGGFPG